MKWTNHSRRIVVEKEKPICYKSIIYTLFQWLPSFKFNGRIESATNEQVRKSQIYESFSFKFETNKNSINAVYMKYHYVWTKSLKNLFEDALYVTGPVKQE